jgi:predicted choloylglycine hydrolase
VTDFFFPERDARGGRLRYHDGVPVLEVDGDAAQVGRQIGELAVRPAAKLLDYPLDLLRDKFRIPGLARVLWGLLKRPSRRLFSNLPDQYRDEIDVVIACGFDRDRMIAANTLFDFSHAGLKSLFGCSSLVVPPRDSATGTMLLGRNLDFFDLGYLHRYSLVTVRRPGSGRLGYLDLGFPGSVGCFSGMNEAGLAVVRHAVLSPKIPLTFDINGVPFAATLRLVMETCRNVPGAVDLLKRTRHASPGIVVMADPSTAVITETTPGGVRVRNASAGVTGCTNHYLDPTLADPNQPNEFRTLDRLATLSKSSADPRDVVGVWAALHAVHQDAMTIQTMVFEPARRALHVAFGPGPTTARMPLSMTFSTLFEGTSVK